MANRANSLHVTVVYSPGPRETIERPLDFPPGATVTTALQDSGLRAAFAEVEPSTAIVGIWGRPAGLDTALRDGDRVEVYRPLKVDPKLARRERFRKQGARAAGLFAGKREGQKAGY